MGVLSGRWLSILVVQEGEFGAQCHNGDSVIVSISTDEKHFYSQKTQITL